MTDRRLGTGGVRLSDDTVNRLMKTWTGGHKAHFKSIQEELKGVFFESSILGGNCLNSKEEDRGISGLFILKFSLKKIWRPENMVQVFNLDSQNNFTFILITLSNISWNDPDSYWQNAAALVNAQQCLCYHKFAGSAA